jgi:hypothetical protein
MSLNTKTMLTHVSRVVVVVDVVDGAGTRFSPVRVKVTLMVVSFNGDAVSRPTTFVD